jgi:iron-sulfur cluster assembly protein
MAVELTEAAVKRVAWLRTQPEKTGSGDWLRIGIRGGGCSGLSYFLDFVPAPDEKDKTFTFGDDVKICVDKKSYLFLNGVTVDFEEGLLKTGFVFKNPQASSTCSCGESFSL